MRGSFVVLIRGDCRSLALYRVRPHGKSADHVRQRPFHISEVCQNDCLVAKGTALLQGLRALCVVE